MVDIHISGFLSAFVSKPSMARSLSISHPWLCSLSMEPSQVLHSRDVLVHISVAHETRILVFRWRNTICMASRTSFRVRGGFGVVPTRTKGPHSQGNKGDREAHKEMVNIKFVNYKSTKYWPVVIFRKPLPLTTVELQKAGSRLLKLAPKKVLDVRL